MSGFTKAFKEDTTNHSADNQVRIDDVNQYKVVEEHDYKEWEKYKILTCKKDHLLETDSSLLEDIQDMLIIKDGQAVPIQGISSIKGGYKYGKKLSDPDIKWTEQWFEAQCLDTKGSSPSNKREKIIVKLISKLWTNVEKNTIEGESCFQILDRHNTLLYEMKDTLDLENVLNKEGSLRERTVQVKKLVPISKAVVPVTESAYGPDGQARDIKDPEFDIFAGTNVQTPSIPILQAAENEKAEDPKFEEIFVNKVVPDKWVDDDTPLQQRPLRTNTIRRFVTQFNGNTEKVREEGIEHYWVTQTKIKTGNWQTIFQGKVESVKELRFTETDNFAKVDPNLKVISREGTNEHGEFWTEEVHINDKTNYKKIIKTSQQNRELRMDGFERKWGESREEKIG